MQLAAKCQTNKLINSWREQTLPVISKCPFGGWSGVKPAAGAARSPGDLGMAESRAGWHEGKQGAYGDNTALSTPASSCRSPFSLPRHPKNHSCRDGAECKAQSASQHLPAITWNHTPGAATPNPPQMLLSSSASFAN